MSRVVQCPLCKQSFKVALPSKIAKGICPRCKGELMLLPDGNLKPYTTERVATPALAQVQAKTMSQTTAKQVEKPPIAKQPAPTITHKHVVGLPVTKLSISKNHISPLKPVSPRGHMTKSQPPLFTKPPLSPTKHFPELDTSKKLEVKEELQKNASVVAERRFIKLSSILFLVPFMVCIGLYATKRMSNVESFLKRSGEIVSDGFTKVFAVPVAQPVKKEPATKPPIAVVKQSDLPKKKDVGNIEYDKKRLAGLISEKLDKFRLKQRTIKKYSEGALKDEQKMQVKNMEKDLEKDKVEIEDMKKEYQNKFGEPFTEGNDN